MPERLPISGVIPTKDRAPVLRRTLESLAQQDAQPWEIVLVDGSQDDSSEQVVEALRDQLLCDLVYLRAEKLGAAAQRNQAFRRATQEVIWFLDDDILLEPHCVRRLWDALRQDSALGGVNALITNSYYEPPGRLSRWMFAWMNGGAESSYAGRCLGPAVNLLPDNAADGPEVRPQDWLNSTCTMYRRACLPDPPFEAFFTGYSLMEDLTVSLRVGRDHGLANVRTARIYHDSQPGTHKSNARKLARMEMLNRHYVMTRILHRNRCGDYLKLFGWEAFQLLATLPQPRLRWQLPARLVGKVQALAAICWPGKPSD